MIYVTIPVYNRKKLLRDCLESLTQQTDQRFKIIVTDDGSTDGTADMLEAEFPEVILIKGDGNLYWTGAINKAVEHALSQCSEQDYILALNDDLVLPPNYIESFYRVIDAHPNALIGSVVTDINDRDVIDNGGVQIGWFTAKKRVVDRGRRLSSFPKGHCVCVSYLTGRGVAIPSKVFRDLGLYNDRHYQQCGDMELPVRAAHNGYKLLVSYDVPVFSYVKDHGHINHLYRYRLSNLKKYYFDVRSNARLRYRFWFAMDATTNMAHGLWYFMMDFVRITGHFVRKLSLAG